MGFVVLEASNREQHEKWLRLWTALPGREVFAHPDYAQLFLEPDSEALCASWEVDTDVVLFPFVMRQLSNLPGATSDKIYDIITPYGYGGAFFGGQPVATQFWAGFRRWCEEKRVVSCFARLSLFPTQVLPFDGVISKQQYNVVCNLKSTPGKIWEQYEAKVRKNVKRAVRCDLTVEVDDCGARLQEFYQIYQSTMERRAAKQFYLFSESFFTNLVQRLRGMYCFFHVLHEGKVVSTELVLLSSSRMYSFLGGTLSSHYSMRPNDLLKHSIIEWGISRGLLDFVLGGGAAPNDGIFAYKKSFAPEGLHPFMVGKQIYDDKLYGHLVQQRKDWLQESYRSIENTDFFPLYRAPSSKAQQR